MELTKQIDREGKQVGNLDPEYIASKLEVCNQFLQLSSTKYGALEPSQYELQLKAAHSLIARYFAFYYLQSPPLFRVFGVRQNMTRFLNLFPFIDFDHINSYEDLKTNIVRILTDETLQKYLGDSPQRFLGYDESTIIEICNSLSKVQGVDRLNLAILFNQEDAANPRSKSELPQILVSEFWAKINKVRRLASREGAIAEINTDLSTRINTSPTGSIARDMTESFSGITSEVQAFAQTGLLSDSRGWDYDTDNLEQRRKTPIDVYSHTLFEGYEPAQENIKLLAKTIASILFSEQLFDEVKKIVSKYSAIPDFIDYTIIRDAIQAMVNLTAVKDLSIANMQSNSPLLELKNYCPNIDINCLKELALLIRNSSALILNAANSAYSGALKSEIVINIIYHRLNPIIAFILEDTLDQTSGIDINGASRILSDKFEILEAQIKKLEHDGHELNTNYRLRDNSALISVYYEGEVVQVPPSNIESLERDILETLLDLKDVKASLFKGIESYSDLISYIVQAIINNHDETAIVYAIFNIFHNYYWDNPTHLKDILDVFFGNLDNTFNILRAACVQLQSNYPNSKIYRSDIPSHVVMAKLSTLSQKYSQVNQLLFEP